MEFKWNLKITEGGGPCKRMRAGLFSGLHSMHTCSHLFALRNFSKFRKEAGGDGIYIDLEHLGRCVIWTAQRVVSIDKPYLNFKLNVIVLQKVQRYCVDESYSGGDIKGEVRQSSPGVLKSRSAFRLTDRKSIKAARAHAQCRTTATYLHAF
jgi:hypothetical protein